VFDIAHLLSPRRVRVQLPGVTKAEVLDQMLALVADDPHIADFEEVRRAVYEREAVMSTGVGKGLALPHAKTPAATGIVAAFATTAVPVAFEAVDDEPVHLVFLLVGPETAKSEHIKTLSRVSRLMNEPDFRAQLRHAVTPEAVIEHFEQSERHLA
jgi:PTS system fructose-specific IIA component